MKWAPSGSLARVTAALVFTLTFKARAAVRMKAPKTVDAKPLERWMQDIFEPDLVSVR